MKKLVLPNEILLGEVERLLRSGTTVTIGTKGNSMLPFIVGGRDCVVLKPYINTPMLAGDIVLARLPGNVYVLHRILSLDGDGKVTLMGDGNIQGKEYCNAEDICGRAIQIVRNGKGTDTASLRFRLVSFIWRSLLPFRRYLLAFYRILFKRNIQSC